ncbi:hypothetical protein LAZ40_11520 [Cereibacter sphaeroides]|uniref:hypothetical protein n=1 Tax=Cereibacter sphaeroides TaxID=1063 RepID=UPI001F1E669F|nr:hypothetical protein [Cereibacter sphaeroides]MCE6959647.1 hypothetical protein [Cereibacter sphaeroides]MCE6974492.1 hypothetical protein [Cereibacter sphaeroides]
MTFNDALACLMADLTPAKLPKPEEVFGKGAEIGTPAQLGLEGLIAALTPARLPTWEELLGDLAVIDRTHADAVLALLTPKRLPTWGDLGALLGIRL